MTTYFKVRREFTTIEKLTRDFGLKDAKGRAMGAQVRIGTITLTEDETDFWTSSWVGTKFTMTPHSTRDGEAYGALQGDRQFETEAEARAAAEAYFTIAAKRASKKGA